VTSPDMNLPSEPGDFSKYEAGAGSLSVQCLMVALHIHEDIDTPGKAPVYQFLESAGAAMAGDRSWLIRTNLKPRQVVDAIRHHLTSDEYVCVFTICSEVHWAGPRHVRRFFEASGVRTHHVEEIPPPVDPRI